MGKWCWGWCCGGEGKLYLTTFTNDLYLVEKDLSDTIASVSLPGGSGEGWIAFDSDGNVYVAHANYLVKYPPDLSSTTWSQEYTDQTSFQAIVIDRDNDWIYTASHPDSNAKGVRKFNTSDGSEITTGSWPVDLGEQVGGSPSAIAYSIDLDSSGNPWVGHATLSKTGNPTLSKFNSSGSLQNDYQPFQLLQGSLYHHPHDIKIDASDNLYCALQGGGVNFSTHIAKVNSSGVLQWEKSPDSTPSQQGNNIVLFDSETKVLVSVAQSGASHDTVYAYEDDGTFLWGDNYSLTMRGVCVDEDDNLYVCVQDTSAPIVSLLKYNSSGTEIADLTGPSGYGQDVQYFPP